ncbi:MAG: hypothetical protein ACREBU_18870 [Nitrososphaera sp.]
MRHWKILTLVSRSNRKLLVSVSAIVSVALAIVMYYLFMPAWVIVRSVGEDENALPGIENRFKVIEDDLAEFPILRIALTQADEIDPNVVWVQPAKAWYWEGKSIVERFDMDSSYPPEYRAILIYEDNNLKKVYHVQVVFGYEMSQY